MRKFREKDAETGDDRSVVLFESFYELLEHNKANDCRSKHMGRSEFYGAKNMQNADDMARKGLPRSGVEALKLAHNKVALMAGELIRPAYEDNYDVSGSYVDMGRFVTGEPECMVDYLCVEEPGQNKIVTLILNIGYNCAISAEAIKKNGQAAMSLVEAIETQGMQAEIWVDNYVRGRMGVRARTAVKLKRAGEAFDVAMFMYALTDSSFLRSHIFNAMHTHDSDIRRNCGIEGDGYYGFPMTNTADIDDFPPYSIYIPCISTDSEAGKFVPLVLKQLNLVKA